MIPCTEHRRRSGTPVAILEHPDSQHSGAVVSVSWSPDGKHVAAVYDSKTAVVWGVQRTAEHVTFEQYRTKWVDFACKI